MVSVILPYNKDRGFLQEAIASAEAQTYKDYELVVHYGDANIGKNFNDAIEKANGDYIKFLAEDDLLPPDSLDILTSHIGDYDFVYGDGENFGDLGGWPERVYDKTVTFEMMLRGNCMHGGGVLYKTKILRDIGGFDETLLMAEEYDLHLRLLRAGYRHKHIPEVVYRYRLHEKNKCNGNRKWRREYVKQIRKRYI